MKTKFILLALVTFVLVFVFVNSQQVSQLELEKGKNTVVFNNTEKFYVKTLFDSNENIEVVSYNFENKSIGYIRAFGGIGKNFIVESNKEYEVIVSENTTITLPQ